MCLSHPLASKLTKVNPFPTKEIRERGMGVEEVEKVIGLTIATLFPLAA